jgi:5-(carboxyamino)imidazole ribonucleotide synthase
LIVGNYDDEEALADLLKRVGVVTYEFENVPASSARFLEASVPVYPPPAALDAAQDRVVEKQLLERMGFEVAPFAAADTRADLDAAIDALGLPVIVKTRRGGYDGKGQASIRSAEDVATVWDELGDTPLIVEGLVDFVRELSIIGVRGRDGATAFYPLTENEHRDGILRRSTAPASGTAGLQSKAEKAAAAVMEELHYVGVLAIELFDAGERLIANEMAPRVHNSGHWTIEGAETSQFENHMRAVLDLPLGSTAPRGYSVMINLIGAIPDPAILATIPNLHLHLYGKEPRPGRKVGHVTLRTDSQEKLREGLQGLRRIGALPDFG